MVRGRKTLVAVKLQDLAKRRWKIFLLYFRVKPT
jgi:hypothetical protein